MKYQKHLILCFALVGLYGLGYLFIPQVRNLGWFGLIILACPLMHMFMGHGENNHAENSKDHQYLKKTNL